MIFTPFMLLIAQTSSAADAQDLLPAVQDSLLTYRGCVRRSAVALDDRISSAEVVVTGAFGKCVRRREAARLFLEQWIEDKGTERGPDGVHRAARNVLSRADADVRPLAIADVLQARKKR